MSVTLISIKDPFNELRNTITEEDFHGGVLSDYLDYSKLNAPDITYIVCINGLEVTDKNTIINDDDKISVVAKIEYGTAVAIADYVVLAGEEAGWAAAYDAGWMALAEYTAVFAVAFAGIMYGVSALAQSVLGQDMPGSINGDGSRGEETYGWGSVRQTHSEGIRIPYIFGANKVGGQEINKFVSIDGNKETLNVLLGVCDHEIDSITDVRINNQPTTYYRGVNVQTRLGTNSDVLIPGFNEIVGQIDVGSKLLQGVATNQQTNGNSVEKINIVIIAPNGFYYSNDNGGLDTREATFTVAHRAFGDTLWTSDGNYSMSGATTEAQRKLITIDSLPPDQYEVQVMRTNSAESSYRGNSDIYISCIQEIVNEFLRYPGLAKYAVTVLATDQLSGTAPAFSCIAERSTVQVFNKDLATPIWEAKRATNPAWIIYSLLVEFAGIDKDRLVWEDFSEWADYCDEDVGGAYRFILNTVVNTGDFWTQIQKIAKYGRAAIIRRGTQYGVFIDKYEGAIPVISHLFTMGNILVDSFSMQYLPQKDRATAIEIEYNDVDREYTRQVLTVFSNDYLTADTEGKKTNISIEAAISQPQAVREAVFRINNNKYLNRTIIFDAAVDSFACTIGDLFYFQHEVIDYENKKIGSRIINAGNDDGSGNPFIQLDQKITLEVGDTYKITVRLEDDSLIEKTVINPAETTDTLIVDSPWTSTPKVHDLFLFGVASTYKKIYRLIHISRKDDFTRTITGFEYVPEIYSENDSYVIDEPTWSPKKQAATQVTLHEFLSYGKSGSYVSNLGVSWNSVYTESGQNWSVWLEDTTAGTDPIKVKDVFTKQCTIDSKLVLTHTYKVFVVPYGEGAVSFTGNNAEITIQGKLAPPSDVLNFNGSWDSVKRVVHFAWTAVDDIDLAHYEIRQGSTWSTATVVVTPIGTTAYTSIDEGVQETRTYLIKAVDTSGIYSTNYGSADIAIDTTECTLQKPTGLTLTTESGIAPDGTTHVTILATWNNNAEVSDVFQQYELLVEVMSIGKKSTYFTTNTEYQFDVAPNTEYGFSIRAVDKTGNATAWTTQVTITSSKDDVPPAIPSWDVTSLIPGFKVIGLRWQKNTESDLAHYEVQRSLTGAFAGEEVDLGAKDGNFTTDTDLDVDTTYYYRIRAIDTSGNASGWSTIKNTTTLQVGSSDIAYNSIIAEHINVTQLSAISGNVGILTAGILQSNNWSTNAGGQIDLDNGLLKFGGSADPKLSWDGTDVSVKGRIVISSGSSGVSNLSDAGQLASQDSVDWQTQISGTGIPADYADVTPGLPSDENLVGYWSFDDGDGLIAIDSSYNKNDCDYMNPTTPYWGNGVSGTAVSLNYIYGDYLITKNKTVLPSLFTCSVWFNAVAIYSIQQPFISTLITGTPASGFHFGIKSSTTMLISAGDGVSAFTEKTFTVSTIQTGEWHHIALSYDGTSFYIYLDGVFIGSWEFSLVQISQNIVIGRRFVNTYTASFNGRIDEARIYGQVLTAQEIKALYLNPGGMKSPFPGADVTANSNFVNTVYPADQTALQTQIDEKVESWFQSTDPAITWDAPDSAHAGDMWWNTGTNKLKRYDGVAWSNDLTDQKAIDAFTNAASAQSTADGKAVVFTTTPTNYDIGDLWDAGGTPRILKRATVANTVFNAGDWITVANEITNTNEVTDGAGLGTTANWSGVIGTGKPADYADVTDYADYRVSNSGTENSITTIAKPVGGSYSFAGSRTGAIVVTLPQSWTSTMLKFEVDVYLNVASLAFKILVGGNNNINGSAWDGVFAQIVGSTESNNRVRFGHDGTHCCVVIGEIDSQWVQPQIQVKNFQAGHSAYAISQWDDGWGVSIVIDLSGYTWSPGADFSDTLLDAKSILGQGTLATSNSANWTSQVTAKPKIFRVTSVGLNSTSHPVTAGIRDEAVTPLMSGVRSYNVGILDRTTEIWDSFTTHDVWSDNINFRDLYLPGASGSGTTAIAQMAFGPLDCTGLTKANGTLVIDLKCTNWSDLVGGNTQIEITSSGGADVEEWYYSPTENIGTEWQTFYFPLSGFTSAGGELAVDRINYIRWYGGFNSVQTLSWRNAKIQFGTTTASTAMANQLAALSSDKIVCICTYDEPRNNRLFAPLAEQMYRCGGSKAIYGGANFSSHGAYILIGVPGIGQGSGIELYSGDFDDDPNAWADTIFRVYYGNVQLPQTNSEYAADTLAVNGVKGSTIIKDGFIGTDVLTADNIQAGTLDVSKVTISSGDGKTYFNGDTMYVYDTSGTLRVKLGKL